MTAKAKTPKRKSPDSKDIAELERAVKALNAGSHNPVDWAPIIRFVAPIVARLAARIAARYIAGRLKKKLAKRMPQETADYVADKILEHLAKVK